MAIEDVVINASAQEIETMAKRQVSQEISEDSSVDELASAKAVYDAVKKAGSGGIAPLIVTVDQETWIANHTSDEIEAYSEAGGDVYLNVDSLLIPLSWIDRKNISLFEAWLPHDSIKVSYIVWDDGVVQKASTSIATAEDLDAANKDIIDKLCPSFSESGSVVQCEPVEGYPLKVTTELPEGTGAVTLTHCGKNLFDYKKYPLIEYYYSRQTGGMTKSNNFSCVERLMPVGHLKGKTITLNHAPTDVDASSNAGMCFYTANDVSAFISGTNGHTCVVPDNAEYMGFTVPRAFASGTQIQIELGDTVTDFEPYRGKTYTATPSGESHDWGSIPALPGVNTLYCDHGVTTVKGKSDPVAIIEKLTNAIIALGDNV